MDEKLNQIALLLEELAITSDLFYQSLLPTMTALRAGRSLKTIALEENLPQPQDYLSVLRQILIEFEKSISQVKKTSKDKNGAGVFEEAWGRLETEMRFYRQFQETSGTLLQKLRLIAQEGRLSPLGQMPINDAWEELTRMANLA